ncbi:MAG: leucyl aminopeptidase [Halofilum sp. (in: g-proteobacteria)]|nr:leucyl aminopeptidase [Halofilum sp. (in: g-proteobacteria)]
MEFSVTSSNPANRKTDAVIVGIFDKRKLTPAAQTIDEASDGHLRSILASGDLDGKSGSSLLLHGVPGVKAKRVLLVGCGKRAEFDLRALRRASETAAKALKRGGSARAVSGLAGIEVKGTGVRERARAVVEAMAAASYRFDDYRSESSDNGKGLSQLELAVATRRDSDEAQAGIDEASGIAAGVQLARDLANHPANVCTPGYLAEQARALAKEFKHIKTTVLDRDALEEHGMGGMLAVSRGSRQGAHLITMEYRGGSKDAKPLVLVGKGVTFDTGGISIKPAQTMDEMKYDMGGAASVFGVMRACAELGLKANVIGVVPTVENMPDGDAYRPGDIITMLSGQTVEVLNTDAEGRLILADALTYSKKFEPDTVIDMATLTGACIIALGAHASALLTKNDTLARQLQAAGDSSGDRCWRLPLWDDYQEQLKSPFADFANVGGRAAGTITAACFLARFTKDYKRWAHLDIAGTAWISGNEKCATGRPVPLLMQYLLEHHVENR